MPDGSTRTAGECTEGSVVKRSSQPWPLRSPADCRKFNVTQKTTGRASSQEAGPCDGIGGAVRWILSKIVTFPSWKFSFLAVVPSKLPEARRKLLP
jgi:hypothetical protein